MPRKKLDDLRHQAETSIKSDDEDSDFEDNNTLSVTANLYNFGLRFQRYDPKMSPWSEFHPDRQRHAFFRIEMVKYSLYYISPYLTCKECNTINFVDALSLEMHLRCRLGLDNGAEKKEGEEEEEEVPDDLLMVKPKGGLDTNIKMLTYLPPEQLPKCSGCGRTHAFYIGAEDMTALIKMNEKARRKLRRFMRAKATRIQSVYRGRLARLQVAEMRRQKKAREEFLRKMSTRIEAAFRGHLGRRKYRTIWNLARIKQANPLVLAQALRRNKFGNTVFWYNTRPAELRLLYLDYKELVDRLGNRPPLHTVEKNIEEIKKRVHIIECEYATMIQKHFRGLIGRRFIVQYRFLVARLLQLRVNCALVIQRQYRAWLGNKKLRQKRVTTKMKKVNDNYKESRRIKDRDEKMARCDEKAMAYYKKSWNETQSALFTGKLAYGEHNGQPTLALRESTYYSTGKQSDEAVFDSNIKLKAEVKKEVNKEWKEGESRSKFIIKRRQCNKALSIYFKEDFEERRKVFQARIFGTEDRECHFLKSQNIRKERKHGNRLLEEFKGGEEGMEYKTLFSLRSKKYET